MKETEMTEKTCTIGPRATDGARCGKPAVYAWTGDDGFEYAECVDHYAGPIGGAPVGRHAVGDRVDVKRHGKTYTGRVVRVGAERVVRVAT